MKLRPIVSICGTCCYKTAKYLATYLMPLTNNKYNITNSTDFAERLSERSLNEDEVFVWYDVSSLFTEAPLDETFYYIIDEIYSKRKLPQLGSKLLFRRLLSPVTKTLSLVSITVCRSRLMDVA